VEEVNVTDAFVEACLFFGNNALELPSFFNNKLKATIQALTGEGAKRLNADQLLITLGLHRLYEGPLQLGQANKVLEYIKEKKVGSQVFMNQATRSLRGNQLENSELILLRGLRVLHKLM
jgi:hypothetical protein